MAINTQTIRIDLNPGRSIPVAYSHQGDTARSFVFEVYNNGEAFPLTGYTAKIAAMLPADNGYRVIAGDNMADGAISGNTITATLPADFTAKPGRGVLTIVLTGSGATIRPINVDLRIQKSADAPETIAGASDFAPVLERYMAEDMQTYINAWLDAHPEAMQYYISGSKLVLDENGILSIQNDTDEIVEALDLDTLRADVTDLKSDINASVNAIEYNQLGFGESTGIKKIYFTGNAPTTAPTYGVIGRIIECKAGETIYMSGALSTQNITNVKILSAIPSGQYGAIPNASVIGTLSQTENNTYTIPSNLTNCVAAFFPGNFTSMRVADYEALTDGVIEEDSVVNGYAAGGTQMAKIVSKLPFATVPQTTVRYQDESFWISEKKNKAFYASLFKAVSPLVNSNIALLGDSLSQQSAVVDSRYGWLGRICLNYCATGRSWAVGQQRWYNTSSLTKGAVYQVNQLLASDFIPDYVIFEFGTNDVWSGSSKFGSYEDTASDTTEKSSCAMRWCIETIQENYPNARILCIMPMLRNNNGLKPTAQDTYITLADQILDDYSIHRVYPYTDSGIVFDMMKEDGIHLAKMNGNYYDNENSVAVKKYSYIVERGLLELH